jgi:hypothetical protein
MNPNDLMLRGGPWMRRGRTQAKDNVHGSPRGGGGVCKKVLWHCVYGILYVSYANDTLQILHSFYYTIHVIHGGICLNGTVLPHDKCA